MGYAGSPERERTALGPVRLSWLVESWRLFAAQVGSWVVALAISGGISIGATFAVMMAIAIPYAVSMASSASAMAVGPSLSFSLILTAITGFVFIVLQAIFCGGMMKMAIKCVRGELIQGSDVFSGYSIAVPMFFLLLILFGIPLIGYIVVSVLHPRAFTSWVGFAIQMVWDQVTLSALTALVGVVLMPAMALVVDGVAMGAAFKRSFRGMLRVFIPALGLYLIYQFLLIVSCIPAGLGTTVTVPMFFLLCAITARERAGLAVTPPDFLASPAQSGDMPGAWPPPPMAIPAAAEPAASPAPDNDD